MNQPFPGVRAHFPTVGAPAVPTPVGDPEIERQIREFAAAKPPPSPYGFGSFPGSFRPSTPLVVAGDPVEHRLHVSISALTLDSGLQSRAALDPETVQEYAESMLAGQDFPAISVVREGGTLWVYDGFHRVEAAKQGGLQQIDVVAVDGTRRDALRRSFRVNTQHGLRRSNRDKRACVTKVLDDEEWSKWSNRNIADLVGVSPGLVDKIKNERSAAYGRQGGGAFLTGEGETATKASDATAPRNATSVPATAGPPLLDPTTPMASEPRAQAPLQGPEPFSQSATDRTQPVSPLGLEVRRQHLAARRLLQDHHRLLRTWQIDPVAHPVLSCALEVQTQVTEVLLHAWDLMDFFADTQ